MLMDSFDHKVQGTTSTGSTIYKIENTHSNGKLAIKTMEVWAIKGTSAFMILYNADTSEYLNLIPIIQKMVDSFWYCDYASKIAQCLMMD
jgi:hypothetical protein